jgi:multiple sugar transport system substrate-binding protein
MVECPPLNPTTDQQIFVEAPLAASESLLAKNPWVEAMLLLRNAFYRTTHYKRKDMKMKRKKNGFWVLLSIVVIVSFAVVGFDLLNPLPEGGEYEPEVLRVWGTWGDDRDQMQPIFDRFTQEIGQPVKVATGVEADQLEKALASDTPPDVVVLSNNASVASYYQQGWIEPLDGWIETTYIDLDDIYPAPLTQCKLPDGIYPCLPWGMDTFALYWNKDLFAAAGLDPERPPQTMEELQEYTEQLTIRDEAGEFSQVGFIPDYPRSHIDLYAHMFGGSWYTEVDSDLVVNSQPVIDALNWQSQFYNQMGIEEADLFVSSINPYMNSDHPVLGGNRLNCQQCHRYMPAKKRNMPEQGFYDGKVAMMVDGAWQLGVNYIPNFNSELNYGVAPFPPSFQHPERANSSVVQGPVVVIPSGAQDKDVTAQLLAWIMSPETVAEVAHATTLLPSSVIAAQDPRFQQIPQLQVFMDLMTSSNTSATLSTPISMEVNMALAEVEKDVLHKQGSDPTLLLSEVQAELQKNSQ